MKSGKNQSNSSKFLCLVLTVFLLISIIPATTLADSDTRYYSLDESFTFEVDAVVTSAWSDHANIELKVRNTGDKRIDNWHLTFKTPYLIENIWNASIVESDDKGTYTIRNNIYNQDIEVGYEATIGMTLNLGEKEYIELSDWYLLNIQAREVESERYLVSYQEYSKWDNGFNGALILGSQEHIEDWSVCFDSEYEITAVSNAIIETQDNNIYVISNDGYTQNLSANMLFISIQGIPTENEFAIDNVSMKSTGLGYTLTEDSDENGIADYLDYIYSQEGAEPVTPSPTETPVITPIPTITDEPTEVPTVTPEPTATVSPDYDGYLDSDNDGLLNYEEELYGTDKNNPDSDDDGINDFIEIRIGYDPNDQDSDKNEIFDGEEDFDKDGLSNSIEVGFGTCLFLPDSDFDDINDYDEIYVYGTDPNKEDSNDDGILDGDALKLGLNPTSLDSDGDGIPDKDEKFYQEIELQISEEAELKGVSSVEVKGDFTNLLSSTTSIEDVYGKDVYSSQIEAIVGGLVSIETSSDFDTATIVFHYDENEIGVDEEDLCILWYDEANDEYVMLDEEQILDKEDNTISYVTTHFSTYLLVSKAKWLEQWRVSLGKASAAQLKYSNLASQDNTPQYIVAAQMTYYDSLEGRTLESKAYTALSQSLDDENYGGLVLYAGVTVTDAVWNKAGYDSRFNSYVFNYCVDEADSPDFSNMLGISAFIRGTLSSPNVVLYVITEESTITLKEEDFETLEGSGIVLKIIAIRSDFTLVNETGLDVNIIRYSGDDDAFVDNISNNISAGVPSCSDLDDFSDYQELCGFVLSNGTYVTTQIDKEDSDDDGLWDSEEVKKECSLMDISIAKDPQFRELFIRYSGRIKCWSFSSNPNLRDTDFDLIDDFWDARPKIDNPEKIYILCSKKEVYSKNDTDLENQADELKTRYENVGAQVEIMNEVTSTESFLSCWKEIGVLVNEDGSKPYGDKCYYKSEVVIIAHGDHLRISLSDNSCLCCDTNSAGMTDYISVEKLPSKSINGLYLYSCYCGGDLLGIECIAKQFASSGCCESVVAFDTSLLENRGSYIGFWYTEERIISHEELQGMDLTRLAKKGFLDIDYEPQGFIKYIMKDGCVFGEPIYSDDILYGTKYTCENKDEDGCESKFSVLMDADNSNLHDPLLDYIISSSEVS